MKIRIEKLIRRIKMLEKEKEQTGDRLKVLLYSFGVFRIFKRNIRKEVLNLQKLSHLLEM